ncbi:MAG: efflux RND transporter permease subunit [Chloroflexota bacterium]|nr:efflux RND transporter permease subunit [Chloroflexota bacterium]
MTLLTRLVLRRSSVTMLVIVLILVAGVYAYNDLERELFPDIEFPNITITTYYPTADPETIVREVTEPIEDVIAGMDGLEQIQSTSQQNLSIVLATFEFGEDMDEAERTIESNVNGIQFPSGVEFTTISRINNETFPVMQLSVAGDRDIASLQRLLDDVVVPSIEGVDGVFEVFILGRVDERIAVTVDTDKLQDLGLSINQLSTAISGNNIGIPAGSITDGATTFPVRTTHQLGSIRDIESLVIGYESAAGGPGAGPTLQVPRDSQGLRPVLLSDVATVELGTSDAAGIARTLGKPSLNLWIIKKPEANTLEVTNTVLEEIEGFQLPPDVEILEISNNGPIVEESLSDLLREGFLGFLFAITAVFIFLLNTRPTLLRGLALTLRPTTIIAISIPLSVLGGIILLRLTDISLNFMSLAGLAIAVGRVVDDSIVVLENMYRHIQRGEDRFQAALIGTREVGAAIVASTLTTVVVFIPLAFIQGLVGEFFTPFALAVSYALVASTFVALTAVPVLGAALLQPGDIPEAEEDHLQLGHETWLQRLYSPILIWTLRHKFISLLAAIIITGSSISLITIIPVTFFPAGTPDYLIMNIELEEGTAVSRTYEHVARVEEILDQFVEEGNLSLYQVTIGQAADDFNVGVGTGSLHLAGFTMRVAEGAPREIAELVRARLPESGEGVRYFLDEVTDGPPAAGLELRVVGPSYSDITVAARELEDSLSKLDGIVNLDSNVTSARDEVSIRIDNGDAAQHGLNTLAVAQQVNQFIVGRAVTEIDVDDVTLDVVVRGMPDEVDDIEKLKDLDIEGPFGTVKLGSISEIGIERGPVTVTRFDRERSATITGTITAVDTRAVGSQVQNAIDSLALPPGVEVKTGGIFDQVNEGFQDVFLAMAIGVVLVYLVMVASLGSLRDPFIIVFSLPFAVVGALIALAVTDRTLSLSAMMGFLLLIGIVVTNAIVLITFVEQLRERGLNVYDALVTGGRVRIRPILMTAFTTTFALLPLALSGDAGGGIIGAELATVVIGGLISSTLLTLIVVPIAYTIMHSTIPGIPSAVKSFLRRSRRVSGSVRGTS